MGKESTCNAGDTGDVGSLSGLRISPRGENDNPLQYSRLENPMDRGAWWATVHGVTTVGHHSPANYMPVNYSETNTPSNLIFIRICMVTV